MATAYGRYGYRRITALLRHKGYHVNHKRVERIWREQGLKVPKRQQKRKRLWMNDGSCIRLRPAYKNHVWSYDFVEDRLSSGRKLRWLNIIDEYSKECLYSFPRGSWTWAQVLEALAQLFVLKGTPAYLRSDNGSEFTAKKLVAWLDGLGVSTAFIEPGSPWENGYCESFNSRMRDEFLAVEAFDSIQEATVLTGRWVDFYNKERPHSALGYRPPAPEAWFFSA